jgi:hypothetical protein
MKYAIMMGSDCTIPSLVKIDSSIQKLFGGGGIHIETYRHNDMQTER